MATSEIFQINLAMKESKKEEGFWKQDKSPELFLYLHWNIKDLGLIRERLLKFNITSLQEKVITSYLQK